MSDILVHLDTSEVHQLARDFNRHAGQAPRTAQAIVEKGGYEVVAIGQVESPRDTGFNAGSIGVDFGLLSFDAGPDSEYGGVLELGVPHPFVIHARPGNTLHFVIDGHDVFAKSVTHPPISPRPYMGPAFDHTLPRVESALGGMLGNSVVARG